MAIRFPMNLIKSHLVKTIQTRTNAPPEPGVSVARPMPIGRTVPPSNTVGPLVGSGEQGYVGFIKRMRKAQRVSPPPVPTGPSRLISREPVQTGWTRLLFRQSPLFNVMEPIIKAKMAEGKPYAMAFSEAKLEAERRAREGK